MLARGIPGQEDTPTESPGCPPAVDQSLSTQDSRFPAQRVLSLFPGPRWALSWVYPSEGGHAARACALRRRGGRQIAGGGQSSQVAVPTHTHRRPFREERSEKCAGPALGASSLHVAFLQSGNARSLRKPKLNEVFQVTMKAYLSEQKERKIVHLVVG